MRGDSPAGSGLRHNPADDSDVLVRGPARPRATQSFVRVTRPFCRSERRVIGFLPGGIAVTVQIS